ncbi:espin isoform X2 [Neocloeon triangulifer]|uniref:espin isoform X2 n=1 Tax=Neocloeon triangulifer TaxID=2078957 RepID=UPI00286F56B5|nr:espin isoform X2 [Neocloeon triangulifer]
MPALERSSNGALALHYAAARGCLDCVKILVATSPEHSANAQMDNAVTPVYLAAQEGHLDVLRYLVTEASGSLLLRAKDGMAPLHAAAQMGCLPCIKWMVQEQGVDPNLRDGDGATALHFAASRGHADTVRWLLRHGGRMLLDKFGKSPLNDAAENEQIECLSILVQHGTAPDYNHSEIPPSSKQRSSSSSRHKRNQEEMRDSLSDSSSLKSEPFYLHPPSNGNNNPFSACGTTVCNNNNNSLNSSLSGLEIYVNPMNAAVVDNRPPSSSPGSSTDSESSFYLHNPREVIYNRVKDLFEMPSQNRPTSPLRSASAASSVSSTAEGSTTVVVGPAGAVTVRVDVHTSDVRSGIVEENDYEDIYQLREEAAAMVTYSPTGRKSSIVNITSPSASQQGSRPPSRVETSRPPSQQGSRPPSVYSTNSRPPSVSSVSIDSPPEPPRRNGTPTEGEREEKVTASRHSSLPGSGAVSPAPSGTSAENRALKRVVSEPGGLQHPPPPPPPPPALLQFDTLGERTGAARSAVGAEQASDEQFAASTPPTPTGNKHLVLPFVPPKFPCSGSDSLIKPSEYLRSLGGPVLKAASVAAATVPPPLKEEAEPSSAPANSQPPTPGPPPPPLPSVPPSPPALQPPEAVKAKPAPPLQPLSGISIHDLNSVQLRKTERLGKTMSAPIGPAPITNNAPPVPGEQFQSQKDSLIAELKRSRDITGIRKCKVERAKSEERLEKEHFTKLSKQYSVENFVEQVPDTDATGNPIPAWKRQMLAKKAAEKARKEAELRALQEAEEERLKNIPPWKRALMANRKETDIKRSTLYTPKVLSVESPVSEVEEPICSENDKENIQEGSQGSTESDEIKHNPEDDSVTLPLMPWRAQLRKTNSTLNLLE